MKNKKILVLISKTINIDVKKLNINSTNKDFDQWDSLGQLKILFSLQKNYSNIKNEDFEKIISIKSIFKLIGKK